MPNPDDIGTRVRAADGLPEVLAGLIGIGFTFSSVEDYDMAMEWALRAYRAGQAAAPDGPPHRTGRAPGGYPTNFAATDHAATAAPSTTSSGSPSRSSGTR